jgi:hypothetical protein
MDGNNDDTPNRLHDLLIRAEEIGFTPDEMIGCGKCAKPNPPTRTNCLYCGNGLDNRTASSAETALNVRELEGWENGFNVVIVESSKADTKSAAAGLARLLTAESETFEEILSSGKRVPIARMESETDALAVSEFLSRFGVEARIVPDERLQPTVPHVRLRAMTFGDAKLSLELFNSGDVVSVSYDDLALVVPGTLRTIRTEMMEKRKRRVTKTLNEIQTASSEQLIDIYSKHDPVGWRVRSSGFDFSCLDDKSLLVIDNMGRLQEKLASLSSSKIVVDDFDAIEPLLHYCWPSEHRKDALGFQRSGFARKDLSSIATVNNTLQVTKYSRLQWQLL